MGNVTGVVAQAAYHLGLTSETPMSTGEGTNFTSRSATDNSRNNEEIRNHNSRHTNENIRNTPGSAGNTYHTSSNMTGNTANNAGNTYHAYSNMTGNTSNNAENANSTYGNMTRNKNNVTGNANNNIRSAMGNTINTAEDRDSSSRNTTNNPMNIPINTNTARNATNENQNMTRHSTNDMTGHKQNDDMAEKSKGNATPQKVKSYASIVKSGNHTGSSLNNTGRHTTKRFVSTATREKRVVYHYTNRAGAGWISSTGYIKESSETSSFAHFGKGVYLTTLPPTVGKERIAKNNWTKGWESRMDSGKVDFAIRVAVPERKLIKCEAHDRDLFLHKGPLYLANYPEWELEMVTSEANF